MTGEVKRIESAAEALPTRVSQRPSVTHDDFVFRYAFRQALYAGLTVAGVGALIGAVIRLGGGWQMFVIVLGLGMTAAGGAGFMALGRSHALYAAVLGISTSVVYAPTEQETVRAFVPSRNGAGTILAGNFSLTAEQWRGVFDTARRNGNRITRDGSMRYLPRDMYRNWQDTLGELGRLGFVDEAGNVTTAGWEFYNQQVLPASPTGLNARSGAPSTPARARPANARGENGAVGEWE
jgi:hypothetical protein